LVRTAVASVEQGGGVKLGFWGGRRTSSGLLPTPDANVDRLGGFHAQ